MIPANEGNRLTWGSTTDSTGGPALEWTIGDTLVFDISLYDCANGSDLSGCTGADKGFAASATSCDSISCAPPGTDCDGVRYVSPGDDDVQKACSNPNADITLTVCST